MKHEPPFKQLSAKSRSNKKAAMHPAPYASFSSRAYLWRGGGPT